MIITWAQNCAENQIQKARFDDNEKLKLNVIVLAIIQPQYNDNFIFGIFLYPHRIYVLRCPDSNIIKCPCHVIGLDDGQHNKLLEVKGF